MSPAASRTRRQMSRRPVTTQVALLVLVLTTLGVVSSTSGPASAAIDTPQVLNLTGSLTQNGHVFRSGTPTTCAAPKAFPGTTGAGSTFNYAQASYVAQNTGCLTITRAAADCGGDGPNSGNVFVAFYDGSYNPANQAQNYLGDQGTSLNSSSMSVPVTEGHTYQLVVSNGSSQAACTAVVTISIGPNTLIVGKHKLRRATDAISLVGIGGSQFECSLDARPFASCGSSLTLWGDLRSGTHTLWARARDSGGVVDPSPASLTFLRCNLAALSEVVTRAKHKVSAARHALRHAEASGSKADVAKARKQLAKAKKRLGAARHARHVCAR